jgi:hypothetical protein
MQPAAGSAPTTQDKAAEAKRLANMAAELAQQAAALAAESQAGTATASANREHGAASTAQSQSNWTSRESEAVYISDATDKAEANSVTLAGWRTPKNGPADTNIKFMNDSPRAAEAEAAQLAKAKSPADLAANPQSEPPVINDGNVQLVARMFAEDEPLPAGLNDAPSATPADNDNDRDPQPIDVRHADYGARDACGTGCGDSCGTGCADGCCETDCCPPQRVLFWTAGVEATFLNPDLNSEGTSFLVEEAAYERSDWVSTASDDIDSMYVSPRIWLGVQGCKWGANVRYWHLQAGEGAFDPSVGPGADPWDWGSWLNTGFASCNYLEAYTIDFEATRRFCLNDCWMQASAGIRHAEIWQDEAIWGTAITDDTLLTGVARANRMSRGTGVVFGLYGRKPIFPCSCVNWFYNVRWSAMWGPTETSAETGVLLTATNTDPDVTANAGSNNSASTAVDDNLFIGEIQLGLEWDYALQCLPANAFFRAAIEYQRWDGGLGYSSAFSFASADVNMVETTYAETNAAAAAPELDLVGITLGTGLTW